MFVYLDESGDSGFKFTRGSSRFFVVVLLLVDDPIPIQTAIDDLRRAIGFAPHEEFKFSHSAREIRLRFLHELRRHECAVRAMVVDKMLITRPEIREQETFYNEVVRLILTRADDTIVDAVLVLDRSVESRRKQDQLAVHLRRALNTDPTVRRVRRIVHHDSNRDNLIQAADMVSGAIYARFNRGDDTYFRIIRSKLGGPLGDLWIWSPQTQ